MQRRMRVQINSLVWFIHGNRFGIRGLKKLYYAEILGTEGGAGFNENAA